MKSPDPLLAAWDATLAGKKDSAAIIETSGAVARTFGGIQSRAGEIKRQLDKLEPGSTLAVQIGNHPDWPAVLLACLRKGIVVLPLERSIGEQELQNALAICRANAIATSNGGETGVRISALKETHTSATPWTNPPALLKLTSGTTGAPHAVVFRSEQLVADCRQICRTMGITSDDLNFGVIPVSHSYGFSNLLTPLLVFGVPMILSSDRLPRAVLHDLNRSKATVFPGMPLFYQAFCEISDVPALPFLRLCISAGAPLPCVTAIEFRKKFRLPIHSFYGASECGGICYDRAGKTTLDGFVGEPMEGVTLQQINQTGESTQIRVQSAAIGEAYFPEPEQKKLGKGFFVPDDLLSRHDSGWRIVGRVSDLINVAGKKVNPAEVEIELRGLPGVRDAIVFGRKSRLRNEEVVACAVADPGTSESSLLKLCRGRLSGWQVPKRIFIVDKMPVNERGKTSRRQLARRFSDRQAR